jgi:transcriptional regulator with XRE-family HTH domain
LGQRVKALRVAADLSRPALAAKVGLVLSTVYVIERENKPTKPATVEKLAKALGVTVAMLTGQERLRVNGKAANGRPA